MTFIVPVFMRTLGLMFAQARLIPQDHPATMYGMQGVPKTGFFQLMSDAWFELRRTKASGYQWSMYFSVILMIACTIASFVSIFARMLLSTAQAQIFDHPSGGATDLASVGAGPGAVQFDTRLPNTITPTGDLGLNLLDRVIRSGALGQGGQMQNAIRGVMTTYNTGILVVAGMMLFWAVMSVVVDTAKTGTVGGGRHNMVWAPIRIVLALGMIIPLGASGFSSGQYMVMKVAEWGSNFGSRAWTSYITSVTNTNLVSPATMMNPQPLVAKLMEAATCQVAYNVYLQKSTGGLDAEQQVSAIDVNKSPTGDMLTVNFTNDTGDNICGSISMSNPNASALAGADPVAVFKRTAAQAHINALTSAAVLNGAYNFACDLVAESIDATAAVYAASVRSAAAGFTMAGETGKVACTMGAAGGAGINDGVPPTVASVNNIMNAYVAAVNGPLTAAIGTLQAYYNGGAYRTIAEREGWVGAGNFYYGLVRANSAVQAAVNPAVNAGLSGNVENTSCGSSDSWYGKIWDSLKAATTDCAVADHVKVVTETMQSYDKWWTAASTGPTPIVVAGVPASQQSQDPVGMASVGALLKGSSEGMLNTILGWIFPSNGYFLFNVAQYNQPVYPLSQLSVVGSEMITSILKGAGVLIGISAIASLLTLDGVAAGIMSLLTPLFMLMAMPAAMLLFWIPLIPWFKMTMAALSWIISIFEAVVLIPVAALSHITTEGEGIGAKHTYGLWLNILTRPILTVIGFIGAVLVANSLILMVNSSMISALANIGGNDGAISRIANTVIYMSIMTTVVNGSFQLVDIIPNAVFRWFGAPGDNQQFNADPSGFQSGAGQISAVGSQTAMGVSKKANILPSMGGHWARGKAVGAVKNAFGAKVTPGG